MYFLNKKKSSHTYIDRIPLLFLQLILSYFNMTFNSVISWLYALYSLSLSPSHLSICNADKQRNSYKGREQMNRNESQNQIHWFTRSFVPSLSLCVFILYISKQIHKNCYTAILVLSHMYIHRHWFMEPRQPENRYCIYAAKHTRAAMCWWNVILHLFHFTLCTNTYQRLYILLLLLPVYQRKLIYRRSHALCASFCICTQIYIYI